MKTRRAIVGDMDVTDPAFDIRLDDLWISLERHMDEEFGHVERLERMLSEEESFALSRTEGALLQESRGALRLDP